MPHKTPEQERARRRWCKANPRWRKCGKCGGRRVIGLACPACQLAYNQTPDYVAKHRRWVKAVTDRGRDGLAAWYVRSLLRRRPGLPPELVELVKANLQLKRSVGLTNLGKKRSI